MIPQGNSSDEELDWADKSMRELFTTSGLWTELKDITLTRLPAKLAEQSAFLFGDPRKQKSPTLIPFIDALEDPTILRMNVDFELRLRTHDFEGLNQELENYKEKKSALYRLKKGLENMIKDILITSLFSIWMKIV